MPININKIKNVSAVTKSAISRKSAQTLPNNPSEQGYSAEEIKRRFYQPVLDAANSAIAEIDRVVNEMNVSFGQVSDELDNFIDTTKIKEAYKVALDNNSWELNSESNMYEHYITKEEHKIEDYKEIGVNMFLLDGNGKYIQVNQFEVGIDGTVRCFHETNGAGYISIYVKREGFIVGSTVVDADHIVGLAKVGRTNNYEDLDNKPNTEQMTTNEIIISKIISGSQSVNKALYADEADTAVYANTSGTAGSAGTAFSADTAIADQFGVNLHTGYAKQNGNYPNLTAGKANITDNAKADEEGVNIKTNYAKQNGTYVGMSVGYAVKAGITPKADLATKAISDGNGANISSTYAKVTGTYPNMSVGKAVADGDGSNISNTYAKTNGSYPNLTVGKAIFDENGKKITTTYTTGRVIERANIDIEVRVGDKENGSGSVDLFRDTGTTFNISAYITSNINGSDKRVLSGTFGRDVSVSRNRNGHDYLFLRITEIDSSCHPYCVRFKEKSGSVYREGYANGKVTINNKTFNKYDLSTATQIENKDYFIFEILP